MIGGTQLGLYDFEARFADNRVGRFWQPDPLREKYFSISPYTYCANNPINIIDPTGMYIVMVDPETRSTYLYKEGKLHDSNNEVFTPDKGSFLETALNAYEAVRTSDETFGKIIGELQTSENYHYVEETSKGSRVGAYEKHSLDMHEKTEEGRGTGSRTFLNFTTTERKRVSEQTGVESTNETTVAHELQHQYDHDKGNTKDFVSGTVSEAKRPQEIRAVNLENLYRHRKGLGRRTTYGGEVIAPKKLNTYK